MFNLKCLLLFFSLEHCGDVMSSKGGLHGHKVPVETFWMLLTPKSILVAMAGQDLRIFIEYTVYLQANIKDFGVP